MIILEFEMFMHFPSQLFKNDIIDIYLFFGESPTEVRFNRKKLVEICKPKCSDYVSIIRRIADSRVE